MGPPVSAGVKAAFEALEPVKPKIDDVITTAMDKIVEVPFILCLIRHFILFWC